MHRGIIASKFNALLQARHSVFFKLLLVGLVSAFLIQAIVWGHFIHKFEEKAGPKLKPHAVRYLTYLTNDLIDAYNKEEYPRIYALLEDIHVDVCIQGAQKKEWCSNPDLDLEYPRSEWEDVEKHRGTITLSDGSEAQTQFNHFPGHARFIINSHDVNLKVYHIKQGQYVEPGFNPFSPLLWILVILVVAFLIIRSILSPVRVLKRTMERFSQGELSERCDIKECRKAPQKQSELGALTHSFNTLADNIEQMIQSREQLLYDVSHELRTPLSRIKLQLAMMDHPRVKDVEKNISEVDSMLEEVLENARMDKSGPAPREEMNLLPLLQERVLEMSDSKPAINLRHMPEEALIFANQGQMQTVLDNLLGNAKKYSTENAAPIAVELIQEKSEFVLLIQDNGQGIPEEDLPHIFEPFYRVDKSRVKKTKGYGLGMSLVKRILDAHNFQINVESMLEKGTRIEIRMPST